MALCHLLTSNSTSDLFRRNRLDQTEQDLSIGSCVTLIAALDNSSASVQKDTSRESVEASWNSAAQQSRSVNSRWILHGPPGLFSQT